VDACVRFGRGEEQHGGREKESVLATSLEAVFAALYLAGGLDAVAPVVRRLLGIREAPAGGPSPARSPGTESVETA
jgi:ribonuclease-3